MGGGLLLVAMGSAGDGVLESAWVVEAVVCGVWVSCIDGEGGSGSEAWPADEDRICLGLGGVAPFRLLDKDCEVFCNCPCMFFC